MSSLLVEYCGEHYRPETGRPFVIGREGDLRIDDNPHLHRHFLRLEHVAGLWWLVNTGSRLAATVIDASRVVHASLSPQARLPVVFPEMSVLFSAGPTTYELHLSCPEPVYEPVEAPVDVHGATTVGQLVLTPAQKLLVVALAEPLLCRDGTGSSSVPPSATAAARLGWPLTTFNRKLDNVCEKLTRAGVRGLHGGGGPMASNRRARLVEHAVATRLVSRSDLALLPPGTPA